jgi:para-aminobenzoate synthetase component 1
VHVTEALKYAHLLDEIQTSLTLFDYFSTFAEEEHSFLLESGMDPQKLGRYSFAGRKPFIIFKSKDRKVEIHGPDGVVQKEGQPFIELRLLLSRYQVDPSVYGSSQIPFLGGAVGYFGYELNYVLERLPCLGDDDLGLPDSYFMFVDHVLIYDHLENKLFLSVIGFDELQEVAQAKTLERFEEVRKWMSSVEREVLAGNNSQGAGKDDVEATRGAGLPEVRFREMFNESQYMEAVQKAKDHIYAGDVFEICMTHRFDCDFDGDPFSLYRELRRINPAPFSSFLNLPCVKVVSSSPERFVRVGRDRWCASRPIKGTRPRGKTPRQDKELYRELFASIKDRAENMMIVDLVRNDFGRVCEVGSVTVSELMIIEKYATVFQMVSTIVGKLVQEKDGLDLVQVCFPGGSMTGAPKIEAMKIIDSLEPVKRGIYSGSIGYIDYSGTLDLNIVIRTILLKDGKAYFQVGGAIVADSDPRDEYLETLHKAKALRLALQTAVKRYRSTPMFSRGELS